MNSKANRSSYPILDALKTLPKKNGKPPMAARSNGGSLEQRLAILEAIALSDQTKLIRVRDFITFTFDHARWELPAMSALQSQFDFDHRREQLGFLHACATIWEKLGEETPNDIALMIMAMSGQKEKVEQLLLDNQRQGLPPPPNSPAALPAVLAAQPRPARSKP